MMCILTTFVVHLYTADSIILFMAAAFNNHPIASFYNRQLLNQFLAVLPTSLACDVILWTYYQNDDPYDAENFVFEVDLNVSTFCNNGGEALANVVRVESGEIFSDFVASRDITAGEEILCKYERKKCLNVSICTKEGHTNLVLLLVVYLF